MSSRKKKDTYNFLNSKTICGDLHYRKSIYNQFIMSHCL
jgi:hypothetical protein